MPALGPDRLRRDDAGPAGAARPAESAGPRPARGPRPRAGALGGLLLGLGAGALGTGVHLGLIALPGGGALPWGVVLALVLTGSTQWWWTRRTAERGGAPIAAGAGVVVGAFTAVLALYRLPAADRLGLPWTPAVAQAMPVAFTASVAWVVGVLVLGLVLLALAARRPLPGPRSAAAAPGRPRRASTLGANPQPVPVREVDGQS
ncbi:hypothetical protein [Micrococcus sp.]|uniref:hypothetical protein n=1 Tax=Micrococcus sp. TaxID=1271 RepID=UPI002A916732|nr:hypothetical protein [Micrococcus sp.]MDY6054591.1 hypothetical protein [Micrococcus sp.]